MDSKTVRPYPVHRGYNEDVLSQPPHQILDPQMGIPPQHLHGLMARDRGHFHQPQALFKEPGGRFVA